MPETDEDRLVHRGYELVKEGFERAAELNRVAYAWEQSARRYHCWARVMFWFNLGFIAINVTNLVSIHQGYGSVWLRVLAFFRRVFE